MKTPAIAAITLLASLMASAASAQCQDATGHYTFKQSYWANSIWPSQYIAGARSGINGAFCGMVNNGWRRQNLMGQYHFKNDSQELTESGRLKAEWVLTQAPMQRRNLFVQRAGEEEQTAQRVQSVQEFAANISTDGNPAEINETEIREVGHPATLVDKTFVGFSDNRPLPVLPAATGGVSGGN